MSHDRGWRAACIVTIWTPQFLIEIHEVARGVTAMVVGSGVLLGRFFIGRSLVKTQLPTRRCARPNRASSRTQNLAFVHHLAVVGDKGDIGVKETNREIWQRQYGVDGNPFGC